VALSLLNPIIHLRRRSQHVPPTHSRYAKLATVAGFASALAAPAPRSRRRPTASPCCPTSPPLRGRHADAGRRRERVFDWWNAEVGAKLGVKLNYKNFDTRYDTAQTASLWPGIKSEMKPIAVVGLGGPDVAALGPRLPDDQVPLFMSTAGYGYAWKPDSWIINPRPTYGHEAPAR